jgi:hypothetical protein
MKAKAKYGQRHRHGVICQSQNSSLAGQNTGVESIEQALVTLTKSAPF